MPGPTSPRWQVVEEHNRRVGEATTDEIQQCILDITTWLNRNNKVLKGATGATMADLQKLEKTLDVRIPEALRVLLSVVDGGVWLMDKKSLAVEAIINNADGLPEDLIPVARDADGVLLVVDMTQGGAVCEWSDGSGEKLKPSLSAFLEEIRDQYLSGHYEFLGDDIGVVEKMSRVKK